MKILIIDDEEEIRSVIRLALERLGGMTVSDVSGGLEGLTAAREERPDAILLDVMTWGMDGAAVLKALRGIPETASIPVIFITASAAPEEIQEARALGVAGVIPKPFDPMTLADQLNELLKPLRKPVIPKDAAAADEFARVLNSLRQEYSHALPEKLDRLSKLALLLESEPEDAATRIELEIAVHNLHGTAGTYGLARISRIAGEWDAELKAAAGTTPLPKGRAAYFLAALAAPESTRDDPAAAAAPSVLIVDDDPDLAVFLAVQLRADGLRVVTVGNGRDALDRLSAEPFDLIISDISMPGMSGYELCRTVRERGFKDIPFIFCTVLGAQTLRIEGLRCGADDYLVKPVDPQELRLKARNHIARQKQLRALIPTPGLMNGNLADIELTLVLQVLGWREVEGPARLLLRRGNERGEIHLVGSNPVHAVLGAFTGAKAFFRMLNWRSGKFHLEKGDPAPENTLRGGMEGLMLEGMRHQDESLMLISRLQRLELPPEARAVEFVAPEDIRPVLAGIREGRSLEELLNLSPLPDLEILRKLDTMVDAGILRTVAPS